jgi:hypothetical protein
LDKNITTKGVSFNLADPDQISLFEHAKKRPNFSGYVKRLIQRDLEGMVATAPVNYAKPEEVKRVKVELTEDDMKKGPVDLDGNLNKMLSFL